MTGEGIDVTLPVRDTSANAFGTEGIKVEDACKARFTYVWLTWPADSRMRCRNRYLSKYFKDSPRHGGNTLQCRWHLLKEQMPRGRQCQISKDT